MKCKMIIVHVHVHTHSVAMTGRVDCMFQVLPEQEDMMYIGDMLGDGLFVVELDSPSPATPEAIPRNTLSLQTDDSLYVFGTYLSIEWTLYYHRQPLCGHPSYTYTFNVKAVLFGLQYYVQWNLRIKDTLGTI